jgi:hypothetical protein
MRNHINVFHVSGTHVEIHARLLYRRLDGLQRRWVHRAPAAREMAADLLAMWQLASSLTPGTQQLIETLRNCGITST